MNNYLSGKKIYGNDFNQEQIKKWFNEEKEGYSNLESNEGGKKKAKNSDSDTYEYVYNKFNIFYGYNFLPNYKNRIKVVSFGGAYGLELLPIIDLIDEILIIEPSDNLRQDNLNGIPIKYLTPNISGKIDIDNNSCDLITCFGVLHHIPNVTFILNEFERILKPDGMCLIREPIVSMGDWQYKRKGLTMNERGIPIKLFRQIIPTNIKIIRESYCTFTPLDSLFKLITKPYNNLIYLKIDSLFCKVFKFNYKYHPKTIFDKFRPVNVFYVLKKNK